MKIKPEDFELLKAQIAALGTDKIKNVKKHLEEICFYTETRFLFDLFYCIPFEIRDPLMKSVYKYADDSHLETALRKIAKGLGVL